MNADGSGQRNLTREPGSDDYRSTWSPDGRKIAFVTRRDGNWEVYVMNPDGSGKRNLTRNPGNDGPRRAGMLPGRPTGGRSPSSATATAPTRSTS